MKVAVSGATGVIGRRVVPLLMAAGHETTAIVRPQTSRRASLPAGCNVAEASLFDKQELVAALAGHDAVINLATHIPPSMLATLRRSAWRENDRIRSLGSRTIAEAALEAGLSSVIQESVGLAYPSQGDEWVDETTPLRPGANGVSVLDAEKSVRFFAKRGRRGVALRFANFYGPDATQTKTMALSVKYGWAPVPGKRTAYISSVSHDDAAAAAVAALDAPSGAYNVSDDHPMTRADFFDVIADTLNVRSPHFLPEWTAHFMGFLGPILIRSIRLTNQKFREATGWRPAAPSAANGLPSAIRAAASV